MQVQRPGSQSVLLSGGGAVPQQAASVGRSRPCPSTVTQDTERVMVPALQLVDLKNEPCVWGVLGEGAVWGGVDGERGGARGRDSLGLQLHIANLRAHTSYLYDDSAMIGKCTVHKCREPVRSWSLEGGESGNMHAPGGAYLVHAVQGPTAHIASMEDGHGTALQGADTGKGGRPAFVHMTSSTCTCSAA